jgi:UPF0716 family protein affecting phage T7 exclusion
MFGIAMAVENFWERKLGPVLQLMAMAGGLLLIIPGIVTDAIGFGLIALVVLSQKVWKGKKAAA